MPWSRLGVILVGFVVNKMGLGQVLHPVFRVYLVSVIPPLLGYSLTPYSRVPLVNPTCSQLVENFPAFYGTRRFITAFTTVCYLSLS